ncbi:MAG: NADP-dependent phosphogluconate dehydrogenase [Flavobacteriia bacterium]|nr:NADP-dependent phosphogluconate dehydrogenase [Flavobacteriia bacterium]
MSSKIIFIIGVSGVGKSTIGQLLSEELNIPFFDGDDFHPEENIQKMAGGTPLTDQDRMAWLISLNELAIKQLSSHKTSVIVCSALKKSYRDLLMQGLEKNAYWVFLQGSFEQIKERLENRSRHFMGAQMLRSQFDILEVPTNALKINVSQKPNDIVEIIKKKYEVAAEFGLLGLGVMGKSLSRNLAQKGFKLSLYNRHLKNKEEDIASRFIQEYPELSDSLPFDQIAPFVQSLETPRKIMLMVPAGDALDALIKDLLPHLSEGDILIDGGNSHYEKTKMRAEQLQSRRIHFIGVGVSGGEEGALKGPSIMPGGEKHVYDQVAPYLEKIAAKDKNKLPCCTYIGPDGSGHFVKMVHNGIEYVEMQLLAEVYDLLKSIGYAPNEISDLLHSWPEKESSYLLDITIDILKKKEGKEWLVDKILDKAGNKGTGNWATVAAATLGVPSTLIANALFARYTSFYKEDRILAEKRFKQQGKSVIKLSTEDILNAYSFARIVNHHQGFVLLKEASAHYQWNINLSELARIWTQGCIIRSTLMEDLVTLFQNHENILDEPQYISTIQSLTPAIRKVVSQAVCQGLALPCMSESINFLHSFAAANSPANLIQAQRDYFGAHTYQRKDDPSGAFHHTQWNN